MEESWPKIFLVENFQICSPGQERRMESKAVTELSILLSSDLPRPQWT